MKIENAVKALRTGKRVSDSYYKGFYEMFHNEQIGLLIPTTSCAADLVRIMSVDEFIRSNAFDQDNLSIN